jgi:dUTP pyrophosphatase
MLVRIVKLSHSAVIPKYATKGDAGCDLSASQDVVLSPLGRALVSTGIAVEIPDGYVGLVHPRSGLAIKSGLSIVNSPGTIDSGYRGEIKIPLYNTDPKTPISIKAGDRIAQLLIQKVEHAVFEEVPELSSSVRQEKGFGSSGV